MTKQSARFLNGTQQHISLYYRDKMWHHSIGLSWLEEPAVKDKGSTSLTHKPTAVTPILGAVAKDAACSHCNLYVSCDESLYCCVDDSDDEREVSRKRTVRQAASKAVSKQREILLGDGGSEDEEHEDPEEAYMDRTYSYRHKHTEQTSGPFPTCLWLDRMFQRILRLFCLCVQLMSRAVMKTSWWRTMMTATMVTPRRGEVRRWFGGGGRKRRRRRAPSLD